jgi:hypothetical protein
VTAQRYEDRVRLANPRATMSSSIRFRSSVMTHLRLAMT